ncbi:MAG: 1-acyl-sn-glycerol-3-phosphate acyltransferase [Bacilli bacterium]|nr:1-acyl-sn-glycerol-3-phosphate acyltransferase [Bacilli bacterium]
MNKEFKPLSFWRELLLKDDELCEYYLQKRKYEFENGKILKGLGWRDKLHPVLLSLIRLNRKFIAKQNLTVINDKRIKSDKPVIYAITHMGMYDYQIVCEAIKDHQYPFAGDPETMYRSGDGLLLSLNGLIYCDTNSKEDRHIALETSKQLLKNNENLLIYPEGIWNLTSNLLSLPLFPGIINMALETGCDIIPVAVEQYDKDFYVNIGENFKINGSEVTEENKKNYIDNQRENLRNILASLKWEIYESRSIEERKNLGSYEDELKKFVDTRLNEWINPKTKKPYYNEKILKERRFKEKNICFPEDVYSYIKNIKLSKDNAFIFKKDDSLPIIIQKEIKEKLKSR